MWQYALVTTKKLASASLVLASIATNQLHIRYEGSIQRVKSWYILRICKYLILLRCSHNITA
jgi:hypothetical protein